MPDESRWRELERVTRDLAARVRQRVARSRLRARVDRLEERIEDEKVRIGRALYPLVEDASITVELPEVQEGVEAIARLRAELERWRRELDESASGAAESPDAP